MATPTHECLGFGHGRHARYLAIILSSQNAIRHIVNFSPGRLFATNEVKAMLAYVLLNYDVKMANVSVGISSIPDPTSEVMFRKRMPARGLWMPLYRDAPYLIFGWSLSL